MTDAPPTLDLAPEGAADEAPRPPAGRADTAADGTAGTEPDGPPLALALRDHLRLPLQDYFGLPREEGLPARLAGLLDACERALAARGEAVSPEFRDGLMRALPALRTFALSLAGDAARADDLVQETLLKAWANHHRFAPGTRLIAWLFTILRNLFYSEIRKRRREVEDADGVHAGALSARAEQEDAVALKSLYATLERLPASQREALLLVGAEGFTYEEAAGLLNCRVGTVKSRVSRARTQLAALMGDPSLRAGAEPDLEPDLAVS